MCLQEDIHLRQADADGSALGNLPNLPDFSDIPGAAGVCCNPVPSSAKYNTRAFLQVCDGGQQQASQSETVPLRHILWACHQNAGLQSMLRNRLEDANSRSPMHMI